jgi:hypothetical protein
MDPNYSVLLGDQGSCGQQSKANNNTKKLLIIILPIVVGLFLLIALVVVFAPKYVWMCGCVDVWMCGCVDVWMCGCVDVWMCGCVDVWMCGCVGVWMCGCVGVWMCGCWCGCECSVWATSKTEQHEEAFHYHLPYCCGFILAAKSQSNYLLQITHHIQGAQGTKGNQIRITTFRLEFFNLCKRRRSTTNRKSTRYGSVHCEWEVSRANVSINSVTGVYYFIFIEIISNICVFGKMTLRPPKTSHVS